MHACRQKHTMADKILELLDCRHGGGQTKMSPASDSSKHLGKRVIDESRALKNGSCSIGAQGRE